MRSVSSLVVGLCILASGSHGLAQESGESTSPVTGEAGWAVVDGLLGKARSFETVSFEIHTSLGGEESVVKVWIKGRYARREGDYGDGIPQLFIQHPDAVYEYNRAQDTFIVRKQVSSSPLPPCLGDLAELKRDLDVVSVLGTEMLGGKETTVVEVKRLDSINDGLRVRQSVPDIRKLWVWNDTGIVVRREMEIQGGGIIWGYEGDIPAPIAPAIVECKNWSFEDIPDEMFEVSEEKVVERVTPEGE